MLSAGGNRQGRPAPARPEIAVAGADQEEPWIADKKSAAGMMKP
jgi:hypothetical protein